MTSGPATGRKAARLRGSDGVEGRSKFAVASSEADDQVEARRILDHTRAPCPLCRGSAPDPADIGVTSLAPGRHPSSDADDE